MFVPNMITTEENNIAPGKGKEPISIPNDNYCDERAFPCFFPKENSVIKYNGK